MQFSIMWTFLLYIYIYLYIKYILFFNQKISGYTECSIGGFVNKYTVKSTREKLIKV